MEDPGDGSGAAGDRADHLRHRLVSSLKKRLSQDSDEGDGKPTLPFHEIGSRMKAAMSRHNRRGGGAAKQLRSNQRLSRKLRNCDSDIASARRSVEVDGVDTIRRGASGKPPMGYMQLRAANLMPTNQTNDSGIAADTSLATRLLEVTQKDNFCDIELRGKDGAVVKAASFLLACHSSVFEELFYSKGESKADKSKTILLEFAVHTTIKAAVHFCATQELPHDVENQANETNIRVMSQLHLFAQLFKIPLLLDATYRAGRMLMNRKPSLVCATFDECNMLQLKAESENNWGLVLTEKQSYDDDLRAYALDFMRDSPLEVLLGPESGISFLSSSSIAAIICDQEIDVDEYTMWRILNLWVMSAQGSEDDKIATARSLVVSHIQLVFIAPEQLKYQVKKCSYVDPTDVEEAIKEIEVMLENDSPDEKERVIVEGAGDDKVNGVYVLADDNIGLKKDEVMFLKEGDEDEAFSSDFGLFQWGESWGIANCADFFNLLYSCAIIEGKGHTHRRPPKYGWVCVGGAIPGEKCRCYNAFDSTYIITIVVVQSSYMHMERSGRAGFLPCFDRSHTFRAKR